MNPWYFHFNMRISSDFSLKGKIQPAHLFTAQLFKHLNAMLSTKKLHIIYGITHIDGIPWRAFVTKDGNCFCRGVNYPIRVVNIYHTSLGSRMWCAASMQYAAFSVLHGNGLLLPRRQQVGCLDGLGVKTPTMNHYISSLRSFSVISLLSAIK